MESSIPGQGQVATTSTNVNGVAAFAVTFPALYWLVEKSGYITQKGSITSSSILVVMPSSGNNYELIIVMSGAGSFSATANGSPLNFATYPYVPAGANIVVTVVVPSGWYLKNWYINGVAKPPTNPFSFIMPAQQTTISIETNSTWVEQFVAGAGGSVSPSGYVQVVPGQIIKATATPASGYVFDHWNLNGINVGATNPMNFTFPSGGYVVEAVFKQSGLPPTKYNLVVSSNPSNGGTTTPSGATQVDPNTKVKVTANASTGYTFDYWTVNGQDSSSGNPIEVTVDRANFTVVAHFKSGTGWPFERTISLCVSQVVKAEGWNLVGKYIELPTFNVGDYEKYLGAKLQYTIQNRDSVNTIWQPDATIDMNGANVVKIIQVSQGTVKSGEVDVSTLLNKTGNKVKLGQSNLPGNWSEFVYTVKAVIGYSEKPKIDPGFDPSLLNLQWWQWSIIAGVVIFGAWTVLSKKGYAPSPTIIITQPYEYVKERLEERKR